MSHQHSFWPVITNPKILCRQLATIFLFSLSCHLSGSLHCISEKICFLSFLFSFVYFSPYALLLSLLCVHVLFVDSGLVTPVSNKYIIKTSVILEMISCYLSWCGWLFAASSHVLKRWITGDREAASSRSRSCVCDWKIAEEQRDHLSNWLWG